MMTLRIRSALCATAFALIAGSTTPAAAQNDAPYTVAESGQTFQRLQDAINAIGSGKGTIRFAARRFADCGVQEAGDIAFVAAVPGQSMLDGVACEGKAALVLRGRSSRVEGLIFANIRVADRNGAGIRVERGNLTVSQSWFRDGEQGIISGNDRASSITVDKSTFSRLGTCDGAGCAHSIYIGQFGSLTVSRSRFEAGTGGHYVKSRSPRISVTNSSFDDTRGSATNYMIDLPEGATGRIAGNWFVQGRDKENYTVFIGVGAEARTHSSDGLTIADNDAGFAPGISRVSAFVADWAGEKIAIGENQLGAGLKRYERR